MKYLLFNILLLFNYILLAQDNQNTSTEVDILYNYYKQDGNHAAVTGGVGSQELKNNAPVIILKTPISKHGNLKVITGIDTYTSASSGNIDIYSTNASNRDDYTEKTPLSAKDTRKHIDATYKESLQKFNGDISISGGYSSEYDVKSINIGIGLSKSTIDKNHKFSFNFKSYFDEWLLIYPGEFRNLKNYYHDNYNYDDYDDDDHHHHHYHFKRHKKKININALEKEDFNTDIRYTYNFDFSYESILTKRTNFALLLNLSLQRGLLHTPFHRVYFYDKYYPYRVIVDTEHLPNNRKKYALGLRLNHFLTNHIIARTYYRYYKDDFGILAHTFSIETPIKISKSFSISPFFRYHQQTSSQYFAPFARHPIGVKYYTSDYDLSEFSSFNKGVEIKLAPLGGLFNWSTGNNSYIKMNYIQFRYANYQRTDELEANNIAIGTKFTFN